MQEKIPDPTGSGFSVLIKTIRLQSTGTGTRKQRRIQIHRPQYRTELCNYSDLPPCNTVGKALNKSTACYAQIQYGSAGGNCCVWLFEDLVNSPQLTTSPPPHPESLKRFMNTAFQIFDKLSYKHSTIRPV